MNAFQNYVRREWSMWVIGFCVCMFMCYAPKVHAAPVVMEKVDGVKFAQDAELKQWIAIYDGHSAVMPDNFDSIKVVWHGRLKNYPLIMIAGQQGQECETAYRLLWMKPKGDFEIISDFHQCHGQVVTVIPGYPLTKIMIDDKDMMIDFEDDKLE